MIELFHVSEDPAIARFDPRPSGAGAVPIVWAIDREHLRNYLVPRECPRVTFAAKRETTPADRDAFLGHHRAVLAIEESWLERVKACRLHVYQLGSATFEMTDEAAGYYTSRAAVTPEHVDVIDDVLAALGARDVDVRILPSLWALHDAVVASTLEFSMIRMRNALPRPEDAARLTALYEDARMQGLCDDGAAEIVERARRAP